MQNRLIYCCVVFLAAIVGCADPSGGRGDVVVTGKVSVAGTPVDTGMITFLSLDPAVPNGGGIIEKGTYTAKTPPGEKKVQITGFKIVGTETIEDPAYGSATTVNKTEPLVPPIYSSNETPLKSTIKSGKNSQDFELLGDDSY